MAARLWQTILASEVALALLIAFVVVRAANLDAWMLPVLGVLALLLTQYALVALAMGPRALKAVRAVITEPLSFGRAMLEMAVEPWEHRDDREQPASSRKKPAHPVLLVHGLACNRAIWSWVLPRLRASGYERIRSVNLQPLSADIEQLAHTLDREARSLQRECNGERVSIVAHSMGGLVARASLRSLGTEVVARLITLATPHQGAYLARLVPWSCARQTCADSAWLAALNASQEGRLGIPVMNIYSTDDALVPARSSTLKGARTCELRGVGHFGLLRSQQALACVVSALEAPT
jgi:pimeloyl-ACP methyl ester carboxylesterase